MSTPAPIPLTDGFTTYLTRVLPAAWTVAGGIVVALIWADVLGDAPAPDVVKVVATGVWAGAAAVFRLAFGRLRKVWLDGDDLLIGDLRRPLKIPLRDVREVKESRLRQVKTVTLELSRPTPLGTSISFAPKGLRPLFLPMATTPEVTLLRERHRALLPGTRTLVVLAAALTPAMGAAQTPPVLRATEPPPVHGRVLTAEGREPAPRIRVSFANGATAMTADDGSFAVTGVAPGEHSVTLVTPACRSVEAVVRVGAGPSPREVELLLPEAMARMDLGPDVHAGEGEILTAERIDAMRARSLAEVIRRVAPEMVDPAANQPGEATRVRGRNRATVGGRTEPILVLDGVPQGSAPSVLRDLRPDQVAAIQILRGAAGGWAYGTSGGVLRIWTRRGRGGGAVGIPGSCPAWAEGPRGAPPLASRP